MDDASDMLPSCTCADDVTAAWEHIDNMGEVSFDVILLASEQTVNFSLQAHECRTQGCLSASTVRDTLLRIYSKLVDLLEAAVETYAAGTRPWASSPRGRTPPPPPPPGQRVACLPSKMQLGTHTLDDQQSGLLALDLVCRLLVNFADVLRRMGRRANGEGLYRVDERLLKLLSRVTRLADASVASQAHLYYHDHDACG